MEILKSYTMLFSLYFGFKVRTSTLSFALSLCVKDKIEKKKMNFDNTTNFDEDFSSRKET